MIFPLFFFLLLLLLICLTVFGWWRKPIVEFHLQLQNSFSCSTILIAIIDFAKAWAVVSFYQKCLWCIIFQATFALFICLQVRTERKRKAKYFTVYLVGFRKHVFQCYKFLCVEFLGCRLIFSILYRFLSSHLEIFAHFFL